MSPRWSGLPRPSLFLLVAFLLALGGLLAGACAPGDDNGAPDDGESPPPGDGAPEPPSAEACTAPAEWFPQSQTPEPNPDQPFESFCDFHQWAWQSFLWLTQSEGGEPRFETFPTLADVISGEDTSGSGGPTRLTTRTEKADHPHQPLDEVAQAGERGLLVAHNGRAAYYAQYVNPQMFQDIVGKHWNDPTVLNEIPPDTEFETGDVELKAVWKIVAEGEDTSGFFVQRALIDRLVSGPDGSIQVDTGAPPEEIEVALVGLHVVGWVQGHPEAIWATFEHDDNAPDFSASQSPSAPVSDRDWTFYTAGTEALDCNQSNVSSLTLDGATQELGPVTQVCRQFPYGMVPDPTDPNDGQNLAAIQELNASVKAQLAADNVWRNYFEVGAIWTDGKLQPNNDQQAHRLGSTLLSNSVIETFTQAVQSENNCFSCHNTLMYNPSDPSIEPLQGTNLNLSHIILEAYVANQPTEGGDAR